MSVMTIDIPGKGMFFCPGERISVQALWSLDAAPEKLELYLLWHTEGKARKVVEIAWKGVCDHPESEGVYSFSLRLPEAPYSYNGKHMKVVWAFELVSFPGKETVRRIIELSPSGRAIVPATVANDGRTDGYGRKSGRRSLSP